MQTISFYFNSMDKQGANYFVLFHFIMKTLLSILFSLSNYNHLSSITVPGTVLELITTDYYLPCKDDRNLTSVLTKTDNANSTTLIFHTNICKTNKLSYDFLNLSVFLQRVPPTCKTRIFIQRQVLWII